MASMGIFDDLVGKTTIADALVASNGIISQRLAGKVMNSFQHVDYNTRNLFIDIYLFI